MKFSNLTLVLVILSFLISGCQTYQASKMIKKESINYRIQGREAQSKNDWDRAITYYKKASYLDPYNPEILNDLGIAYENKGLYELAGRTYHRAIEVDKNFLPTYFNLGGLYEKMGDIERALEYYKMRVKLSDREDDPWAWKAKQKIHYYEEKEKIQRNN